MRSTFARSWIGACMAVAFMGTLALQLLVFRGAAITNDEGSYLFQARLFATGRVSRPAPPDPELVQFHASMMNITEERWFSRYSAGHPLALVPGVLVGYPLLVPLLLSAATMFATFRVARRWYDEPTARMAVVLMAASPYYLAMHATLLSHTTSLFAFTLYVLASTRLVDSPRIAWGVAAGAAAGYLFNTRPYTAVLVGWPFALWIGWRLIGRRTPLLVRQAGAATITGLLFLGGYFGYNAATTGDWKTSAYELYDPEERPGFVRVGDRQHTPERGLQHTRENLALLNEWWLGFSGSFLALAGLALTRWRATDVMLTASALSLVAGYFFFYFAGVGEVGPVYYYEAILPLSLLGARSLVAIWRFGAARRPWGRRPVTAAAAALGVAWTIAVAGFWEGRVDSWTSQFGWQRRLQHALEAAQPGESLILLDVPEPSWHGVGYDPREPLGPIFVRSDEEREPAILARYPDYAVYRYDNSRLERIQ